MTKRYTIQYTEPMITTRAQEMSVHAGKGHPYPLKKMRTEHTGTVHLLRGGLEVYLTPCPHMIFLLAASLVKDLFI